MTQTPNNHATFDIFGPPMPEALRAVLVNILAMHGATLHIHDMPAPSLDTVAALEADLAQHKADLETTRAELSEAKTALAAVRAVLNLGTISPIKPSPFDVLPSTRPATAPMGAIPQTAPPTVQPAVTPSPTVLASRPHDFAARFAQIVREALYIPLSTKTLLLTLTSLYDSKTGAVKATIEDLARTSKLSRRTVIRHIQEACEGGFFTYEPGGGRGHASRFILAPLDMATMAASQPRAILIPPAEAPLDDFIARFIQAANADATIGSDLKSVLLTLARAYRPATQSATISLRHVCAKTALNLTRVRHLRDRAVMLGWLAYERGGGMATNAYTFHIPTDTIPPPRPHNLTPHTNNDTPRASAYTPRPIHDGPSHVMAYRAQEWRTHLAKHGPQSGAQIKRAFGMRAPHVLRTIHTLTASNRPAEWSDFQLAITPRGGKKGRPSYGLCLTSQTSAALALGWTLPATTQESLAPASLAAPQPSPMPPRPLQPQTVLLDTMCVLEERGPSTLREVADALGLNLHALHNCLSVMSYREIERRTIPESRFHILYLPDQYNAAVARAESMRGYRLPESLPRPIPAP